MITMIDGRFSPVVLHPRVEPVEASYKSRDRKNKTKILYECAGNTAEKSSIGSGVGKLVLYNSKGEIIIYTNQKKEFEIYV